MYASKESTDIAFLTYLLVEAYLFCSKRGKILKYRNIHKDSDGRKNCLISILMKYSIVKLIFMLQTKKPAELIFWKE